MAGAIFDFNYNYIPSAFSFAYCFMTGSNYRLFTICLDPLIDCTLVFALEQEFRLRFVAISTMKSMDNPYTRPDKLT